MPLTKLGKRIKKSMKKTYGKNKGERVFYAWENKNKGVTEKKKKEVAKKTTKKGKATRFSTTRGGAKATGYKKKATSKNLKKKSTPAKRYASTMKKAGKMRRS